MDRIDLHVEVTPVGLDELSTFKRAEVSSKDIANRVAAARKIQVQRFKNFEGIHCNAHMSSRMVREVCTIDPKGQSLLKKAMERLQLSARAYDRILKVARTAADLSENAEIKIEHLAEAIQYRSLDRENWAE